MKSLLKSSVATAALLVLSAGVAQANTCTQTGTSGDDTLSAGPLCTNWILLGLAGDDTLTGGANRDQLWPGTQSTLHSGHDTMTGNGGSDFFVFETVTGAVGSNADEITDFTHGTDFVNLYYYCHAASVTCSFIGASPFSGTAGEIRYGVAGGSSVGVIQVDIDGDATSDLDINLDGAPAFDSGDLSLTPIPRGLLNQKSGTSK